MDIKFTNVSFKYKGTRNEVLSHTTLAFTENRIYGLLGKNGVGKSTMLYLAAGLLEPTEGTVRIAGEESKRRRPEILKEIFFVPEEFSLPNVRLSEYVSMNAPFYPNFSREMLDICLKDFGMSTDVNLGELSMGQKKKVFMSFALATGTRILLMDEPTNGHTIEEPVPQGYEPHDGREPHRDNINPPGARCGAADRPRGNHVEGRSAHGQVDGGDSRGICV